MTSLNLRSVDLNLLTIFESVMQLQNLSHAAEALGMTQPAVSQSLKRLQTMYNDPLFEREGRGMKPTSKAIKIAPTITHILNELRSTLPLKGNFDPLTLDMDYRINTPTVGVEDILYAFVRTIAEKAPNVRFNFATLSTEDPATTLRSRQYDLTIDLIELTDSGFLNTFLYEDSLAVIARKNHPRLANLSELSLAQYYAERHVVLEPREHVHLLNKVTEQIGNRAISVTVPKLTDMISMVEATDYISVLPYRNAVNASQNGEISVFHLPITPSPVIPHFISWHWSTEHLQPHRWLRNELLACCRQVIGSPD